MIIIVSLSAMPPNIRMTREYDVRNSPKGESFCSSSFRQAVETVGWPR